MNTVEPKTRQTKYCLQIEEIVQQMGHASNAEILLELHKTYPDVSATTVHRATARLASREELGIAPPDRTGAMRYDANVAPHDHFMCSHCGMLRDVDIAAQVAPLLEDAIEGCSVSGRVTISGTCKQCRAKEGM
ncbi:transcriptional repressor [Candidatus Saccharibacteria bacterium]|nr:transcriptional repressor [Candidatus Saccharibacteria bacterium]